MGFALLSRLLLLAIDFQPITASGSGLQHVPLSRDPLHLSSSGLVDWIKLRRWRENFSRRYRVAETAAFLIKEETSWQEKELFGDLLREVFEARPIAPVFAELVHDGLGESGSSYGSYGGMKTDWWSFNETARGRKRSATLPLADTEVPRRGGVGEFWGIVSVGTPAQEVKLVFDTGSSDLWVLSTFLPPYSSTFDSSGETFIVADGVGKIEGKLAKEVVTVAGLTVAGQTFATVDTVSPNRKSGVTSGTLGLGFPALASSKSTPFLQNLLAAGEVSSPVMGFAFGRGADKNQEDSVSQVTFGGIDESMFLGDIFYVPLKSKSYWEIGYTSINTESSSIKPSSTSAVIDTASPLIVLPLQDAAVLFATIPGSSLIPSLDSTFHVYQYPCATSLDITFEFDDVLSVALSPNDLNIGVLREGSSMCVAGIVGGETTLAVLGLAFLKNVYTVFDASGSGRVGFATPSY